MFSFLGAGPADLAEDADLEDSAARTARLRGPAGGPAAEPRLHELEAPSEKAGLPDGIALTLEFLDGPQRGHSLAVTRTRCMLGRDPVGVRLEDPLVSRRHAVLEIYDAETVILQDLSSTNGTWHNGRLIERCKLNDGDEVRLGSSIFTVQIDHPPA